MHNLSGDFAVIPVILFLSLMVERNWHRTSVDSLSLYWQLVWSNSHMFLELENEKLINTTFFFKKERNALFIIHVAMLHRCLQEEKCQEITILT